MLIRLNIQGAWKPLPEQYGDLRVVIETFEKQRKIRCRLIAAIMVVAIGVGVLMSQRSEDVAVFIFPVIAGVAASGYLLRDLQRGFKEIVVPQVLKHFNFSYDLHADRFPLVRFETIIPSYSTARLEDHFWGNHKGIDVEVVEARLVRGSGKNKSTVFDGLLCRFDFPKFVSSKVIVLPEVRGFRALLSNVFSSEDHVRLEDPHFEQCFDVYSVDQVAARYALTPTMMQRLIMMDREYGDIAVLFNYDEILIAMKNGPDLFHPGSFLAPIDPEVVVRFERDLIGLFDIIADLKLNAKSRI